MQGAGDDAVPRSRSAHRPGFEHQHTRAGGSVTRNRSAAEKEASQFIASASHGGEREIQLRQETKHRHIESSNGTLESRTSPSAWTLGVEPDSLEFGYVRCWDLRLNPKRFEHLQSVASPGGQKFMSARMLDIAGPGNSDG